MGKHVSLEIWQKFCLSEVNWSFAAIARHLNLPNYSARTCCNNYLKNGSPLSKKKTGWPRSSFIRRRNSRKSVRKFKKDPLTSVKQLRMGLQSLLDKLFCLYKNYSTDSETESISWQSGIKYVCCQTPLKSNICSTPWWHVMSQWGNELAQPIVMWSNGEPGVPRLHLQHCLLQIECAETGSYQTSLRQIYCLNENFNASLFRIPWFVQAGRTFCCQNRGHSQQTTGKEDRTRAQS